MPTPPVVYNLFLHLLKQIVLHTRLFFFNCDESRDKQISLPPPPPTHTHTHGHTSPSPSWLAQGDRLQSNANADVYAVDYVVKVFVAFQQTTAGMLVSICALDHGHALNGKSRHQMMEKISQRVGWCER